MIIKIIGIGVIGAFLSLVIKQYRPEIALTIPILVAISILTISVPHIKGLITMLEGIAESARIDIAMAGVVLKIIGIAYVCQFASDICTDAGEKSIASKIELGGKLTIVAMSMPIIYNLLELVSDIINF